MPAQQGTDRRRLRERGAALVEFAILAPLLLTLVLGIVEFAWLFAQNNDVRHGAREAARQAAVDAGSVAVMGASTCNAMDIAVGATIDFTDSSSGAIGTQATVKVTMPVDSITGFFDSILPSDLESEVKIRLEQASDSWSTGSHTCT